MRPVEKYVQCEVDLGPAFGGACVHAAVSYDHEDCNDINDWHRRLQEACRAALLRAMIGNYGVDADTADHISKVADRALRKEFGDVPRFIEVWDSTAKQPITQWYAPHRVPVVVDR